MAHLRDVLKGHIVDDRSGWSMGAFGAIAEFHQDRREYLEADAPTMFVRATPRGALRLNPGVVEKIVPVAYEVLSLKPHRWSHGLALCLPQKDSAMTRRRVLTELGADEDAVRPADRKAILFDMGLDLPQCDFCIRTEDPDLLVILRANAGRSLFNPGNPASDAIRRAHLHRVALTRIGRIEVFREIGEPDTAGVSPARPHTHLLPQLLKSRHTHSTNLPIPRYHVPLGYLHPANPVIDRMGRDRDFDIEDHARFQLLFERFARQDLPILRKAMLDGLARRMDPEQFLTQHDRFSRATMHVTLRQQYRLAKRFGGGSDLALVSKWQSILDSAVDNFLMDEDVPGHGDAARSGLAVPLAATG